MWSSDALHVDHSIVVSLLCHQLIVCSDLCHFATVDHRNHVSVLDGRHAVGDHDGSAICVYTLRREREREREKEGRMGEIIVKYSQASYNGPSHQRTTSE